MYRLTARETHMLTEEGAKMESEIVDRDGKLFVLDPWQNHFSKPIKYRTCWPTGILTSQYKHLVGKRCRTNGTGVAILEDKTWIRLEHGPDTTPDPDQCEERQIAKSPGCHEYRNGRWRR